MFTDSESDIEIVRIVSRSVSLSRLVRITGEQIALYQTNLTETKRAMGGKKKSELAAVDLLNPGAVTPGLLKREYFSRKTDATIAPNRRHSQRREHPRR